MKFLLTSAGVTNKSIEKALTDLIGKPISEINFLFIPTAANPIPGNKKWLDDGIHELKKKGYKSVDVFDIEDTSRDIWQPHFEAADLICFGGGEDQYLIKVIRETGIDKMLPDFLKSRVYMGISAGSMLPVQSLPKALSEKLYPEDEFGTFEKPLGYVDCIFVPHFDSEGFQTIRKENIEPFGKQLSYPLYACSDGSALKIIEGTIEVVGEGECLVIKK